MMASYHLVKVKFSAGTYTTSTVQGFRASCTSGARQAVERLGEKLYGEGVKLRIEEATDNNWRLFLPEAR